MFRYGLISLTAVFFSSNCLFAYSIETGFWAERQRQMDAAYKKTETLQLAHVPAAQPALPFPQSSLRAPQTAAVLPARLEKSLSDQQKAAVSRLLRSLPQSLALVELPFCRTVMAVARST